MQADADGQRRQAGADLLRIHDGEDDVRVLAVVIQTDAAHGDGRQSPGQAREVLAAVGRLEDAAAFAVLPNRVIGKDAVGWRRIAEEVIELVAHSVPGRHEQRLGLGGMHLDVNDACLIVDEEYLLPALAAVDGLVETSILAGPVEPAQCADVDDVGILGVDFNAADLKALGESHVLPGLAAIGRFVDAVAVGDRVARVIFAGADPDDIAVRRSNAHVTDRDRRLVVELVLEGDAVVHGLDQPARGGRDPVGGGVGLKDRKGGDPSRHVRRADRAPGQRLDPVLGDGAVRRRQRGDVVLAPELLQFLVQSLNLFFQVGDFLVAWFLFAARRGGPKAQAHANGQAQAGHECTKR